MPKENQAKQQPFSDIDEYWKLFRDLIFSEHIQLLFYTRGAAIHMSLFFSYWQMSTGKIWVSFNVAKHRSRDLVLDTPGEDQCQDVKQVEFQEVIST